MSLGKREATYILVLALGFYFSVSIFFVLPLYVIFTLQHPERLLAVMYVMHRFFLPALFFFIPPRLGAGYGRRDILVSALFFGLSVLAAFNIDKPIYAPAFRWQWNAVLAYSFLLGVLYLHFRGQGMGVITAVIHAYNCVSLSGATH